LAEGFLDAGVVVGGEAADSVGAGGAVVVVAGGQRGAVERQADLGDRKGAQRRVVAPLAVRLRGDLLGHLPDRAAGRRRAVAGEPPAGDDDVTLLRLLRGRRRRGRRRDATGHAQVGRRVQPGDRKARIVADAADLAVVEAVEDLDGRGAAGIDRLRAADRAPERVGLVGDGARAAVGDSGRRQIVEHETDS